MGKNMKNASQFWLCYNKKNDASSCVGSGYPQMDSWTKFVYGQISIETATHSLICEEMRCTWLVSHSELRTEFYHKYSMSTSYLFWGKRLTHSWYSPQNSCNQGLTFTWRNGGLCTLSQKNMGASNIVLYSFADLDVQKHYIEHLMLHKSVNSLPALPTGYRTAYIAQDTCEERRTCLL